MSQCLKFCECLLKHHDDHDLVMMYDDGLSCVCLVEKMISIPPAVVFFPLEGHLEKRHQCIFLVRILLKDELLELK